MAGSGITATLLALLVIVALVKGQGVDQTRIPNSSGADVVQAAVQLIVDSGVFPADNNFLRRIACVESKDGTDPNTYRAGYDGGIWQVDLIGFQDTQNTASHPELVNRFIQIQEEFGINWPAVQWNDLRKPLYSAIAARIFLANIPEAIPAGADVAGQARYWKQYYNRVGAGTEQRFIDEAQMCDEECEVEGIDLAFVMDGSGSIGSRNFETAKTFVRRVAEGFNIGPDNTRVGVIQYSSSANIEFDFDDHTTNTDVETAVSNIRYQGGGTNTGRAIGLMTSTLFGPVGGARARALNIPRVGVIITDGRSGDAVLGPANTARDAMITMFAIGVANYEQSELNQIANDPDDQFSFTADNFDVISNIRNLIGSAACRVPVVVPINMPIVGTLNPNAVRYASYTVPPSKMITLKLETPTGQGANAYFSTKIRNPSTVFYDYMLETSPTKTFDQVFIDFNQANMPDATDVFATIENKATGTPGADTDTSYNLVGEEGNTLIPVPTLPPQEFPCGPSTLCANGGTCVRSSGGSTNYICQCQACYSGQRCEIDNSGCANFACQNGGQCTTVPNSCGQTYCTCPPCVYGRFCEQRINACANDRCQNGAMCIAQGSCRDYQCLCSRCFSGQFCELPLANPCNSNPCRNGGTCSPSSNCYSYQCQCANGFTGVNCEIGRPTNMNLCNNFPCLNGGTCVSSHTGSYVCICRSGWAGRNCGIDPQGVGRACLSLTCQNGATCYESSSSNNLGSRSEYVCVCAQGYTGPSCLQLTSSAPNLDACRSDPIPCQNGGMCSTAYMAFDQRTRSFCACPIGYIGSHCEIQSFDPCSSTPCLNNGICTAFNSYFTCQCRTGFQGVTCADGAVPTNPCVPNSPCVFGNCFQSGTTPSDYFCQCNSGYSGLNCDIPVADPCASNPCQNGICASTGVSFTCQCQPGFIGITCSDQEIDTSPPNINGCPNNINQVAVRGQPTTRVSWTAPTPADPNEIRSMDQNYPGVTSFIVDIGGVIHLEYSFTDNFGNTAVCAFVVSASAPTGPIVNGCPGNMKYELATGQRFTTAVWTEPTSTPGVPVIATHRPGSQFETGSNLVTYTFGTGMDRTVCAFLIEVREGIDVCATRNPCQNGGQCVGPGRNFQCICLAGFTGVYCTGSTTPCNSRPCFNGGTCTSTGTTYSCTCPPSFSGVNCQIPPVGAVCNPNPCFNSGTCIPSGGSFQCTCPPGFSGTNCQFTTACDSNPCQNGGLCNVLGSGYSCTCPSGFTDPNCQIFSPQGCNSNPCQNGGLCNVLGSGYSCICPGGYTGVNCQIFSPQGCNSNPCQNGGLCNVLGSGYSCTCPSGYTGVNCQIFLRLRCTLVYANRTGNLTAYSDCSSRHRMYRTVQRQYSYINKFSRCTQRL